MELTIFFSRQLNCFFDQCLRMICYVFLGDKVLLLNTVLLLLSFPFLSSIKAVYSHQHGNMNEEIDGGLCKDKKRENVKKMTFEN